MKSIGKKEEYHRERHSLQYPKVEVFIQSGWDTELEVRSKERLSGGVVRNPLSLYMPL